MYEYVGNFTTMCHDPEFNCLTRRWPKTPRVLRICWQAIWLTSVKISPPKVECWGLAPVCHIFLKQVAAIAYCWLVLSVALRALCPGNKMYLPEQIEDLLTCVYFAKVFANMDPFVHR